MSGSRRQARPSHRRRWGRGGFLLAEALVTMAIGAFLLVALVSLVQLAVRIDARTRNLSQRIEMETRALEALARDLRPALRVRWGGTNAPFVFAGAADTVRFAVRDEASGEIRLVDLRSEPGHVLRTSVPLPPDALGPDGLAGGATSEIETGSEQLRFTYVEALAGGAEALTEIWDAPLAMPSAVEVALSEPGSGAPPAVLRIPLAIDAEPGCAAPRRAMCSYAETGEADLLDSADLPTEGVDAQDPLGWSRYVR